MAAGGRFTQRNHSKEQPFQPLALRMHTNYTKMMSRLCSWYIWVVATETFFIFTPTYLGK